MATHSSVLAWRIPGTREPGGLPSMGSHRVGHDWSDLAAAAAAYLLLQKWDQPYLAWLRQVTICKALLLPSQLLCKRSFIKMHTESSLEVKRMQYAAHSPACCLVVYVCVCLLVVDDWRATFARSSALAFSIADPLIWNPKVGEVLSINKYIFQVAETYTPEVIYIYMQNTKFREVKWFFQGNTAGKLARLVSGRSRTVFLFAHVSLKLSYLTEGDFNDSHSQKRFPGGSDSKASVCDVGDPGSIPGLGRSPGGGNGNPPQYSCLENPMDGGAW